ncbi:MAG TPA: T9SS type A sorting domain-containing protein [Bacteroidia bacterium]|nr:T9SS type A sorting domain-containing protein [Bacteroidia bacterium]
MKKSILLVSLFTVMVMGLKAQCTIAPTCSVTTGYCTTPAAGASLPPATEMIAYSTTIQVSVGTTFSGATINNGTVTSVTGLPAGLSYSINPSNGVIAGGGNGCMLISGTPATGSAASYTVTASVSVNTNFGTLPATITWNLTVNSPAGIASFTPNNASTLLLAPNPAKTEMNVSADFHFQKVRVFDALGNLALTQDVNGASTTTVMVDKLNSGFYFLQVTDGNKVVTRKFIKE